MRKKQKIYLICILVICSVLCGCGGKTPEDAADSSSVTSVSPAADAQASEAEKPEPSPDPSGQAVSVEEPQEENRPAHLHETDEVIEIETAQTAVSKMNAGVNIGNALDCIDDDHYTPGNRDVISYPAWRKAEGLEKRRKTSYPEEWATTWGNPILNENYIKAIKDAGFGIVRLPVTWNPHCDEAGNIDEEWLDYVQQIVDWILEQDMYCLINMHHDCCYADTWIQATEENYNTNADRVATIWRQIAERFKNYDEKLLFQGYNELGAGEYTEWLPEGADNMIWFNKYTQLFVDTVRATGGNNATRNLVIPTLCARFRPIIIKQFELPQDSTEGHLIISVHYYHDSRDQWSPDYILSEWTGKDEKAADEALERMKELKDKWDAPLIITEGSLDSNTENTAAVLEYIHYFFPKLKNEGIVHIWWDAMSVESAGVRQMVDRGDDPDSPTKIGSVTKENVCGLFDRFQGRAAWTEVIDALVRNGWGK